MGTWDSFNHVRFRRTIFAHNKVNCEPAPAFQSRLQRAIQRALLIPLPDTLWRGPDRPAHRENSAYTPNCHERNWFHKVTCEVTGERVGYTPVCALLAQLIWYSDEPNLVINGIIYLHSAYSKPPSALKLAKYFKSISMLFALEFSENMMTWVNLRARDPNEQAWVGYIFNLPKMVATGVLGIRLEPTAELDMIDIVEAINLLISKPQVSATSYGSSHPVNFTANHMREFAARGGITLE